MLKNGVEPERIGWVMPRDSWMFNRALIQCMNVNVPAMQPPPFEVEYGARCVAPNASAFDQVR